jgi:hypothetical protein
MKFKAGDHVRINEFRPKEDDDDDDYSYVYTVDGVTHIMHEEEMKKRTWVIRIVSGPEVYAFVKGFDESGNEFIFFGDELELVSQIKSCKI